MNPAETIKKLSSAQFRALVGMNSYEYGCASPRDLSAQTITLVTLELKQCVVGVSSRGWENASRTAVWEITPFGIAVLAALTPTAVDDSAGEPT